MKLFWTLFLLILLSDFGKEQENESAKEVQREGPSKENKVVAVQSGSNERASTSERVVNERGRDLGVASNKRPNWTKRRRVETDTTPVAKSVRPLPRLTATATTINTTGTTKKKKRKSRQTQQREETPLCEDEIPSDSDEPTYCLCAQISHGKMVCCDNDQCPIEWFHFPCVGLTTKPKGKWFCPKCRGDRPNVMKPKQQFLKYLEKYNKEKKEKAQ